MASAFLSLILSLNPVHRMMGISGLMAISSGKLHTVHIRHIHICYDQIKPRRLCFERCQGIPAAGVTADLVSQSFQHLLFKVNNGLFIIHQQDMFRSSWEAGSFLFQVEIPVLFPAAADTHERKTLLPYHCKP
jgi:hypothetical protein